MEKTYSFKDRGVIVQSYLHRFRIKKAQLCIIYYGIGLDYSRPKDFGKRVREILPEIPNRMIMDMAEETFQKSLEYKEEGDRFFIDSGYAQAAKDFVGSGSLKEVEPQEPVVSSSFTPIDILDLDTRTLNALVNSGFSSVESVVSATWSELCSLRGFGEIAKKTLVRALYKGGCAMPGIPHSEIDRYLKQEPIAPRKSYNESAK